MGQGNGRKPRSSQRFIAPTLPRAPACCAVSLAKGRPLVMGVLNVTPDSFSDGGRFLDPAAAIAQAQRLAAEGADILDIGAESSRPYGNAVAVPLDEERARLAPILPAVVALGIPVSIDTMKAAVAAWALDSRRRDRQRRLGPATRPRHGACRRRARCARHRHAQSRRRRSEDRHRRRRHRFLRALARHRGPRRHSTANGSCSIPASASARRRSRA